MIESPISNLYNKLRQILAGLTKKSGFAVFDDIARRAFINNAFDGSLTILGILMGYIILGEVNPRIIITTGFGACLAMGMSGAFGRYLSERAERKRTLAHMESYMFTDLKGSILEKESRKKVFLISLVDGLSPALSAIIPLIPFFLSQTMIIPVSTSLVAAFLLDFLVLFVLGVILGRISGENIFLHGILVVTVGFITSVIMLIGSIFLNNTAL